MKRIEIYKIWNILKQDLHYFQAKTMHMLILKVTKFLCNWHTFIHVKTSAHWPFPTLLILCLFNKSKHTERPSLIQRRLFLYHKDFQTHKIRQNNIMNLHLLINYFSNIQHIVLFHLFSLPLDYFKANSRQHIILSLILLHVSHTDNDFKPQCGYLKLLTLLL